MSDPAPTSGVMPPGWTLPAIDAANREWFTSATLAVQTCTVCATMQHPPEEICHVCGSLSFSTTILPGEGTVHSFTVVHHPVHPSLDAVVPYTVVLVSLDAAPHLRVVGNLVGAAPTRAAGAVVDDVAIGAPVEAVWLERTADDGSIVQLPQWRHRDRSSSF